MKSTSIATLLLALVAGSDGRISTRKIAAPTVYVAQVSAPAPSSSQKVPTRKVGSPMNGRIEPAASPKEVPLEAVVNHPLKAVVNQRPKIMSPPIVPELPRKEETKDNSMAEVTQEVIKAPQQYQHQYQRQQQAVEEMTEELYQPLFSIPRPGPEESADATTETQQTVVESIEILSFEEEVEEMTTSIGSKVPLKDESKALEVIVDAKSNTDGPTIALQRARSRHY